MNDFITINGEPHPWRADLDLAALLAELAHEPDAIATAVNAAFVPRARRASTILRPGDALTLIQPITGG